MNRVAAAASPATPFLRLPGVRPWTVRLFKVEPWLVGPCAVTMLSYPNPLVVPAAIVGTLPIALRWLVTGRPWRTTAVDVPLALLLMGALLGGWAGLSPEGAALRLYGLLAAVLLYAAIVEHATSPRHLQVITLAFLVGVSVATLVLLVAVAPTLRPDRVPWLSTVLSPVDASGLAWYLTTDEGVLQRFRSRAEGVGALADMGLAIFFALCITTPAWRWRLALGLAALVFALVLVVADNRGSILGAVLALGALAGMWRPRLLPLVPLAGLAALALFWAGIVQRGLDLETVYQRLGFWDHSLYLARELPFTGAGLGTDSVQTTYRNYFQSFHFDNVYLQDLLERGIVFQHAHNIYLQALLEQGVLGLLGLVGLAFATLWSGWRARVASEPRVRAASMAGFGMALALFGTGLTEIVAVTTVGGAVLMATLGLLMAADMQARATDDRPQSLEGRGPMVAGDWAAPKKQGRRAAFEFTGRLKVAAGVVSLVALLSLLIPTGLGARLAALALLNGGTVELNRATLGDDASRSDRGALLQRAVSWLRTAAALEPSNPTIHRNLALALAAQGDNRAARLSVYRARDATPASDQRAQFQLGRAYLAAGLFPEASRAFSAGGPAAVGSSVAVSAATRAISGLEGPESAPQLMRLGDRFFRLRNWDRSIAAFTAAAIAQPDTPEAYVGIARAAAEREDNVDMVVGELQPLIERGGLNEYLARLEVARLYREAGRPNEALETLRLAEQIQRDPRLALEQGQALAMVGRWAEAEPLLVESTAAFPDDGDPLYWLGVVQLRFGRHEAAIATAQAGLAKIDPRKPEQRARFLGVIGEGLLGLDRRAEALSAYDEATGLTPDDGELRDRAERARASPSGSQRNLIANPGFEWDGVWRLARPGAAGRSDLGSRDHPAAGKRAAAVSAPTGGVQYAIQELHALEKGATYRVAAQVRAAGVSSGAATLRVIHGGSPGVEYGRSQTTSADWTTLEVTFRADQPSILVEVGFLDGANAGAVAWFDEVTLTLVHGAE